MTKDINIHNLSIEEIEQILRDVGYEDEIVIRGALDIAHVTKVEDLDSINQVSLVYNTWMTTDICLENDGVSEQYNISDIAKKLYEIENK